MALTYTLTYLPDDKLEFKRERSYFATVVAVAGGLLFAFGGLAIPLMAFKVLAFLCGIAFSAAALYLPSMNDRFVPEQITFVLNDQIVVIEMTDGSRFQIPLNNLKEFIIDTEKRSPSAANSVGVHYLHYHINLKRHNGATWTVSTTTDVEEAKTTFQTLTRLITQPSSPMPEINMGIVPKIQIETGEPTRLRWQEKKYELTLVGKTLEYIEYNTKGQRTKNQLFSLESFNSVRYSYSAATKNKNWTITICFGDQPEEQLNLHFRDLNPVECLQLECWLDHTIQKKLSQ